MKHLNEILGMILAGGRVDELSVLTIPRPKSAMPIGGVYRVIDCVLTNLSVSGINRVGILSQFRPGSLMDHVGSGKYWDFLGINRSVRFLPPHTGKSAADWYKGTADALFQNIPFIKKYNPKKVLIASGDHIYRMNYDPIFDLHEKMGAAVTIAVTPVPKSSAKNFGIVKLDKSNRVISYAEKPELPKSDLASMTVYLFETDILIEALEKNAIKGKTFQIYDEILPVIVREKPVYAYVFKGFWSYSRSIDDFYKANMFCLGSNPPVNLKQWKLFTNYEIRGVGDPPPALIGKKAVIKNSLISPGCIIEGHVTNSVLSPNSIVRPGAHINRSIIFDNSVVGEYSEIHNTIIDKNVTIGKNAVIGSENTFNFTKNKRYPELLSTGLTIIGKNCSLPHNVKIGRNVIVFPFTQEADFPSVNIKDGETIGEKTGEY